MVFMPRSSSLITIMVGVGVIIVIIDDPWSSWQVGRHQINIDCGHRRCQHQLWSSSLSASTVVIISSPRARRARRRASSACRASNTSRVISRSCGRCCLPRAIVESGRGLEVNYRIDRSIKVGLRTVVALVRSQRCRSRSRSKSMGLNKLKQGGHTVVDNWPWPGGHSTSSSPTLFMVGY